MDPRIPADLIARRPADATDDGPLPEPDADDLARLEADILHALTSSTPWIALILLLLTLAALALWRVL